MRLAGGMLVGAFAVALAAACAPGGGDGDLTDEWPAMPTAVVPRPAPGACHSATGTNAFELVVTELSQAKCDEAHATETVHVGDFGGADAGGQAPPAGDSAGTRAAFTACDAAAKDYLGDDWRAGRLRLFVFAPTAKQWAGGARFYRCELIELSQESGKLVARTGSLRSALSGTRPLAVSCMNDSGKDDKSIDEIAFVECAAAHTGEFVGVHTVTPAGRAYPGTAQRDRMVLDGCKRLGATYLGISLSQWPQGLSWFFWGPAETGWKGGNQGYRCYVGVFDRSKPIRAGATLKGLGTKPLPR